MFLFLMYLTCPSKQMIMYHLEDAMNVSPIGHFLIMLAAKHFAVFH